MVMVYDACPHCGDPLIDINWCRNCGDIEALDEYKDDQLDKVENPTDAWSMNQVEVNWAKGKLTGYKR